MGQHLVDAATRATKRGAELTNKLLAFSRRQVLRPKSVDLDALLNSLADMLRRTVDQRIRIDVAYFSDRGRLFQSEGGRRFSAMADGVSI